MIERMPGPGNQEKIDSDYLDTGTTTEPVVPSNIQPPEENPEPQQQQPDQIPPAPPNAPPGSPPTERKVLKRRMSNSGSVEVRNEDKTWRPLTAEEVDQYLDLDEWRRRHPGETPAADKFPIDFQDWTEADESAERPAAQQNQGNQGQPAGGPTGPRIQQTQPLDQQQQQNRTAPNVDQARDQFRDDHRGGGPTNGAGAPEGAPERNNRTDDVDHGQVIRNRPERGGRRAGSYEVDERRYEKVNVKSVREILADERDAHFFGLTLSSLGRTDLADVLSRYHSEQPTTEDLSFMRYAAHEFSRSMKLAEDTNAKITPEELELLSRRSIGIRNLIGNDGPVRGLEIAKNAVVHMAMKNPEHVEEMLGSLKGLAKDRDTNRYRKVEARRDALAKRLNFDPKKYDAMINLSDSDSRIETKRALEERIHESAGRFRKALDWVGTNTKIILPGSSRAAAIRAMMQAEKAAPDMGPTAWVLGRIDQNLEGIVSYLGPSVGNAEARALIAHEVIRNKNTTLASERGPKTFAQTQALTRDKFSQRSVEARIRQLATPEFRARPQHEQDSMLTDMREQEQREQGGGGFWAWLFKSLFGENFNNAASSVLGRPVHA